MLDICKCPGGDCPLKEGCYRYRANSEGALQTYFITPPFEGDKCSYFMAWTDKRCDKLRMKENGGTLPEK